MTDGGWELEAGGGYHEGESGSSDWWEPKVHAVGQCKDEGVVG